MNFFNQPSVVAIQETKLRQNGIVKLKGYQVFEMNRPGLGGGLLTAVRHELEPVLVYQCEEESEILVVQIKVGSQKVRVFNAYGPQEHDTSAQVKLNFWHNLEKEIMSAYEENCEIVMELDANAKVGPNVIPNDPNVQSENGRYMMEMLARQNLHMLNSSELCNGTITRQRNAAGRIDKSILYYVIVSANLFDQAESMY